MEIFRKERTYRQKCLKRQTVKINLRNWRLLYVQIYKINSLLSCWFQYNISKKTSKTSLIRIALHFSCATPIRLCKWISLLLIRTRSDPRSIYSEEPFPPALCTKSTFTRRLPWRISNSIANTREMWVEYLSPLYKAPPRGAATR